MSDIDYKNLRSSIQEVSRKGTFPFPSYAEALFSHVLVSRRPIKGVWEKPKQAIPIALSGPKTSRDTNQPEVEETSERKKVLQSLGRFVTDSTDGTDEVAFPGGAIKVTSDALNLRENELEAGEAPAWIEELTSQTKVIFFGDKPKDFSQETPNSDLLSKMISAMKLAPESYSRAFIEKDYEVGRSQWHKCLKSIEGVEEVFVVSLGAMATNIILGKKERLSKVHGKEFQVVYEREDETRTLVRVYPVFHPDILQINPNMKRSAWLDLQKVMKALS